VGRAEGVVFAFGSLGKPVEAVFLAQCRNTVAAAGHDFVRIGLMADVPDQTIVRRVEDVVQRHGQFDHTQAGAQVATGNRHRSHRLSPELMGQRSQLFGRIVPEVGWGIDGVEQRRLLRQIVLLLRHFPVPRMRASFEPLFRTEPRLILFLGTPINNKPRQFT
jgi:hypothetical protein